MYSFVQLHGRKEYVVVLSHAWTFAQSKSQILENISKVYSKFHDNVHVRCLTDQAASKKSLLFDSMKIQFKRMKPPCTHRCNMHDFYMLQSLTCKMMYDHGWCASTNLGDFSLSHLHFDLTGGSLGSFQILNQSCVSQEVSSGCRQTSQ